MITDKENCRINVAAAIICREDEILVCQRSEQKAHGLKYEFPGGKQEEGETAQQALKRECMEELGVALGKLDLYCVRDFDYPDICVRISFFLAEIEKGEPRAIEHACIKWVTREEALEMDFCSADSLIVKMLNASPNESEIRNELFAMQDKNYALFNAKLIPNIDSDTIIGVRMPMLRAYAKKLIKTASPLVIERFMNCLPHEYFEENNLHAALIMGEKDMIGCIDRLEKFLPYIDNWATCDMLQLPILMKHPEETLKCIDRWLASGSPYTVRFGLGMLMKYLGKNFKEGILERAAAVRSEEYYVNMMIAWFFATALTKRYDEALIYIKEHRLARWVHNKAIQKARESRLVSEEHKAELNKLKR